MPTAGCQFRLRGAVLSLPAELEVNERQRHWQGLTPGGRALWGWPAPGKPLEDEAFFPAQLSDQLAIPACFQLLRIGIAQVELLELTNHPHRRRRWCRADDWAELRLNP